MQKRSEGVPEALKRLPAVSRMLETAEAAPLLELHGPELVTGLLRHELERVRREILAGRLAGEALDHGLRERSILAAVQAQAAALLAPRPRPVINATGVVVHTNLGRSTLAPEAAGPGGRGGPMLLDLEYDVATGERGSRMSHLAPLMERLFPAQGFTVVNNNAAAVLLVSARARRGPRGADLTGRAGRDRGLVPRAGHPGRYPVLGCARWARPTAPGSPITSAPCQRAPDRSSRSTRATSTSSASRRDRRSTRCPARPPRAACRSSSTGAVETSSTSCPGDPDERPVGELLRQGADLVTFSGDKLLGGPQAGFVVGPPELVERVRRDPLARVCRLDRLLVGALHRTLSAYVRGRAFEEIPTLRMLALQRGGDRTGGRRACVRAAARGWERRGGRARDSS